MSISVAEFARITGGPELQPYRLHLLEIITAIPKGGKIIMHPRGLGFLVRFHQYILRYSSKQKKWVEWV